MTTPHLLEGTLTCELPNETLDILAGDHLMVRALEQPLILTATTEARFLYVSPEPTFHQISQELDDLRRLAAGVEFADGYTAEHCGRLQATAYAIGEALDLPKHLLHRLDYATYLHDVGTIEVPKEILTSPNALDAEGWTIITRHPVYGAEMLANTFMAAAAPIVAQHHERLDGSGYPYGLSGDEILLESHIVAVADTFDAMTSDRPYRPALSRAAALDELRTLSGRSFPREVVEALEQVLPQLDT
jgi:HD-GYP domain-containing protein (c-di-GMP phosphodiesterase class II)